METFPFGISTSGLWLQGEVGKRLHVDADRDLPQVSEWAGMKE